MKRLSTKGKRSWPVWGLLVVLLLSACSPTGRVNDTADVDEEDIVAVFIGDLAASAAASGQLEPQRRATLTVASPALVVETLASEGDRVRAGQVLVQLDTTDLALNLAAAEQSLAMAETDLAQLRRPATDLELAAAAADVAAARGELDDLLAGPSAAEVTRTAAGVREAEASLLTASAGLESTRDSITPADIEAAKAELVAAEYQLEQAQKQNERFPIQRTDEALRDAEEAYQVAAAQYNRLLGGADAEELDASQADLAAAAARRASSQASLDDLLSGATADEIAAARYQLAAAEAALADLQAGPSESQIRIAAAEVAQARLALEDARADLADAQLVAPFDETVVTIFFEVGELASGPVVELVDLSSLELVLSVDEADISQISPGQAAVLTLASFPEERFNSTVRAIAPTAATAESGIVSYDVHLALAETELPVRVGMTGDARLLTEQKRDVLLVPNAAIRADRQSGKYYVNLLQGDAVAEVEVNIGLRDSQNTQILSGLDAGDRLVIDYQPPLEGFPGPGGGGGPFGGG